MRRRGEYYTATTYNSIESDRELIPPSIEPSTVLHRNAGLALHQVRWIGMVRAAIDGRLFQGRGGFDSGLLVLLERLLRREWIGEWISVGGLSVFRYEAGHIYSDSFLVLDESANSSKGPCNRSENLWYSVYRE